MRAPESGPDIGIEGATLGAVLAGGRSTRFGDRKALARVAGIPLVARAAAAVGGSVDRAVVITGDADVARAAGLPARRDRVPGAGPLGGLVTALELAAETGASGVLLVGVDMPFLTAGTLRRLLHAARSPATVPAAADGTGVQPLCGWYSVDLLPEAARRLESGRLQLRELLAAARALHVADSLIAGDLPPSLVFMNVNTRADLAMAEQAAALPGFADV